MPLRFPLTGLALVGLVAMAIVLPTAFGAPSAAPSPTRQALAQTDGVAGAPGRELILSKVVVPPGASIPLHRHQGTQISRVVAGTLSYTVQSGAAELYEGESDQEPQLLQVIQEGRTAQVRAGQWLIERPDDVHRAANHGTSPVVIYLATLLKKGAAPSTPVDPHPPGDPR